jgi:diaminohydroxyphosphoribosylaminopyrimidine deaminase/5-amino-6-(5-phosphoribosylamino)uracil reductase
MMLLLEGGAEFAGSALSAGVVDHVEFHIAPKILGGKNSRPAVGGKDPEKMLDALELENVNVTRYGDDVAVSGDLKKREK